MALSHSPQIVKDGLVLYLDAANIKSYPGTGSVITDLSGNANHGTLINGPTFTSTNLGGISLDGINDYITVADNPTLNFGTGDFTVLLWVTNIPLYPGGGKCIIQKGSRFDSNISGWSIIWAGSPQDLYFIISSDSARFEGRTIPNTGLNGWTGYKLIGLRRSGGNWSQIVDNKITSLGTFTGNVSGTSPINIGHNSSYNSYLSNTVSSVQIYNRALSLNEIIKNFNATRGRYGI
jgi:hypothetical protein